MLLPGAALLLQPSVCIPLSKRVHPSRSPVPAAMHRAGPDRMVAGPSSLELMFLCSVEPWGAPLGDGHPWELCVCSHLAGRALLTFSYLSFLSASLTAGSLALPGLDVP